MVTRRQRTWAGYPRGERTVYPPEVFKRVVELGKDGQTHSTIRKALVGMCKHLGMYSPSQAFISGILSGANTSWLTGIDFVVMSSIATNQIPIVSKDDQYLVDEMKRRRDQFDPVYTNKEIAEVARVRIHIVDGTEPPKFDINKVVPVKIARAIALRVLLDDEDYDSIVKNLNEAWEARRSYFSPRSRQGGPLELTWDQVADTVARTRVPYKKKWPYGIERTVRGELIEDPVRAVLNYSIPSRTEV